MDWNWLRMQCERFATFNDFGEQELTEDYFATNILTQLQSGNSVSTSVCLLLPSLTDPAVVPEHRTSACTPVWRDCLD
jgi:hypothetical protein